MNPEKKNPKSPKAIAIEPTMNVKGHHNIKKPRMQRRHPAPDGLSYLPPSSIAI
jgi:hypothetical protein